MSTFNPSRAVAVSEGDDEAEMDSFLAQLDARAKSLRTQIMMDAFKELTKVAKLERENLLKAAMKEFGKQVDAAIAQLRIDVAGMVADGAKAGEGIAGVADQSKRMASRVDALHGRSQQMESLIGGLSDKLSAHAAAMSAAPVAAPSLAADEHKTLLGTIQSTLDQMRKAVPVAPHRASWNFAVHRDERARITDITATPQ